MKLSDCICCDAHVVRMRIGWQATLPGAEVTEPAQPSCPTDLDSSSSLLAALEDCCAPFQCWPHFQRHCSHFHWLPACPPPTSRSLASVETPFGCGLGFEGSTAALAALARSCLSGPYEAFQTLGSELFYRRLSSACGPPVVLALEYAKTFYCP